MTTRDGLIEALAENCRDAAAWGEDDIPYDLLDEVDKQRYRVFAMRSWPLIVAFVAGWIEDQLWLVREEDAAEMAAKFRDEMTP